MIVDANLLLFAVDENSSHNAAAAAWLEQTLNGDTRVGLPWQTIGAFLRIVTHPRVTENPLSGTDAWRYVEQWLAVPVVWVPPATENTARVYARLCAQVAITGNLVPDAQLAALAIEHGVEVASADTDFMRFPGLRWTNPLSTNPNRS
ncbi:TA system VapC family ribonuclease toxin [Mycobacterium xenopi]|uniref:Ribonuclease VapC n=1 Tax=Mycobacterium xenopi TaxID=1789 RepID=A0AAD1M0L1_MYCXE|nr:TA system VapC family ribonuclease toxin [Mycobacterium xenopi]EID10172.1 PIN domain-containing protein family protein [Mycobacterium xenopi RIVM700367]MDA3642031.1 PIN domain-containing protein [Mycobacterium xenopi]MDA3659913.1 PIN domain-containing protein [Mycobacterium xenopi]MDA3661140.1 PIN domain-containing protein [Mycobacterium xenopi]ORX18664.1 twitching motility protein PilT [Mycobacterium xenopi]